MINNFKNLVAIFALSILTTTYLNAQLFEVPLDRKIESSFLIVEGMVTKSESFIATDEKIYTAHEIEIHKILKGTEFIDNKVTVITMGGKVDELLVTWSNFLTLDTGEKGIFFLKTTYRPNIENRGFPTTAMEVYSSSQGFFKYFKAKEKTIAIDPFNKYDNLELQVFEEISKQSGETVKIVQSQFTPEEGDKEKCLIFSIEPANNFENLKIGADIKVRMQEGSSKLYQSLVVMIYDTTFFGSNVVQNGFLELVDGDISTMSAYNLTATDLAPNKLQLKLEPTGGMSNLHTVTEQKSFLASVYISIANPLGNFEVSFDYDAMAGGNLLYDDVSQSTNRFECIKVESEVFPLVCPNVVSFSTSTGTDTVAAGVGDIVTITGTDFGTPPAGMVTPVGASVLFTKTEQNGSPPHEWMLPMLGDYISWTDTEIKVKVPSIGYDSLNAPIMPSFIHAGTGIVGVIRDGCIDTTTTELYVKFSVYTDAYAGVGGLATATNRKLTSRNGEGGYDLYFSPTFDTLNGGDAVPAFKRSLTTWRCATGVNYRIKEFADIPVAFQANACKIDYGAMPAGVPATTVAYTDIHLDASFCAGSSTDVWYSYLRKFDLIFGNTLTWHTGTDTPTISWTDTVDLETTALHELGHAHMLTHSNNPPNLMHWKATQYQRIIPDDDLSGGLFIVQISAVDTFPACQPAMQKVPFSECDISTGIVQIEDKKLKFIFYPNPVSELLQIQVEAQDLTGEFEYKVFNTLGQSYAHGFLTNGSGLNTINVQNLPQGVMYFLIYERGLPIGSFKFIKI